MLDHYLTFIDVEHTILRMTRVRCMMWIVTLWAASFAFALPPFITSPTRMSVGNFLCLPDWSRETAYYATATLIGICFPLFLLVVTTRYYFTKGYMIRLRVCKFH